MATYYGVSGTDRAMCYGVSGTETASWQPSLGSHPSSTRAASPSTLRSAPVLRAQRTAFLLTMVSTMAAAAYNAENANNMLTTLAKSPFCAGKADKNGGGAFLRWYLSLIHISEPTRPRLI
eukprot:1500789-Rhodomonas_salina.4